KVNQLRPGQYGFRYFERGVSLSDYQRLLVFKVVTLHGDALIAFGKLDPGNRRDIRLAGSSCNYKAPPEISLAVIILDSEPPRLFSDDVANLGVELNREFIPLG